MDYKEVTEVEETIKALEEKLAEQDDWIGKIEAINITNTEKLKVAVELIGDCVRFIEDERGHNGSSENNGRTNHFFMMNAAKLEKIKAK
jgi:uncharacterized coiled-coil protein SlyX